MGRKEDIAGRRAQLSPEQRALLERRLRGEVGAVLIPPRADPGPAPLSFTQERFWFIDRLDPGAATYVVGRALRLTGPLDVDRLMLALDTVVARHAILRTCFPTRDGRPVQVVHPPVRVPLPVERAPEDRVAAAVREEVGRGFDLARGPLVRMRLLCHGKDAHTLVLAMHHIIFDGWSTAVFVRDLLAAYRRASLPPLPLDAGDVAAWERGRVASGTFDRQRAYWRQRLAGTPVLELPTDRPRPPVQTYRGGMHRVVLPGVRAEALEALARAHDGTLFMALLAAFQVLLHRYTGQEDLAVGCPVSGRSHTQMEDLVGCFIKTLVMRGDLTGDPSFRALLQRLRTTTLEALSNQDVPFEQVVEDLNPPRDLSRPPLFQVVFQLRNIPPACRHEDGLAIEEVGVDTGVALYELELDTVRVPEGLECRFLYNADLFESGTIRRMATHFERLLAALVEEPDRPVSRLPLMQPSERHRIIYGWNDTARPIPAEGIVAQFEARAEAAPETVAVVWGARQLTFGEMSRWAGAVALRLRDAGMTPGTPVGVYLPRGPAVVAALFGIWKAGGVYVPMEPAYPHRRLAFMARSAGVVWHLTDAATWDRAPLPDGEPLFMEDRPPDRTAPVPAVAVDPGAPAYIIFTSGSTGDPKAALLPHRQVMNRMAWMAETYPLMPGEAVAQRTALSFVDSLWEILGPPLAGVPMVIVEEDAVQDPTRLVAVLAREGVTRLWVIPSLLEVLLDRYPDLKERLPRLTFWVTSGEAIAPTLYRRFQAAMPHATLYNLYGTSEVWDVTWYTPDGDEEEVPIGRPIANMEAYVLDRHLEPVPVGVVGELYVGGVGLADGYLNRPDLTAERFLPHPFSDDPGARLYRTGDRARYLPDGNIVYMGRVDDQLKWRGYRIEPAEIEARLRAHPGVRQAAVALKRRGGTEVLVGYVVPGADAPLDPRSVREELRTMLPAFMIPSAFVFLDALPLTPSGKIDHRALPDPEDEAPRVPRPLTETERRLAGLWEDVLGIRPIGPDDDFFELGGHSLLAAALFDRIHRRFGRLLPLRTLFQTPTVAGLARHLDAGGRATDPVLVPIRPEGSRPPLFVVPPAGSSVVGFSDLARLLGPDQPVYGLGHVGLDGRRPPHERVEKMAACYLEAIRSVQSEGPYYLAGRCFGGVVAFEMAHQLRRNGDEVALLVLFDTGMPGGGRRLPVPGGRRPGRSLRRRLRRGVKRLRRGVNIVRVHIFGDGVERVHRRVLDVHKRAMRRYEPIPFPGRIVYFHPVEQDGSMRVNPARWAALATEGITYVPVPGSHQTMMHPPHVQEWVARLQACLESRHADSSR